LNWRARHRVPDLPSAARDFEYGARIFEPDLGYSNRAQASDLEKLTLFMDAARKLNTIGVLDEILVTLLDAR